jgi:hypothetical protein
MIKVLLCILIVTIKAQNKEFYGKMLENQGPKLACMIYHDLALYDFRRIKL